METTVPGVPGVPGDRRSGPGGADLVRLHYLADTDRRALSPLFWTHVNPYGRFELDMNSRLDLALFIRATLPGPRTQQGEAAAAPA